MNILFSGLTIIGQMIAQVLVIWLFLHWIGSLPKSVTALAGPSQRERAP
jgi:hypothetical protein